MRSLQWTHGETHGVAFFLLYQQTAEELLYFDNVISGSVASETACLSVHHQDNSLVYALE